ncbi:hypothetical protein OAV78_00550 [bacterium]|nr:hypothetical protein [bacterium]
MQHLSDDYVSWLNDEAVTFYSEQRHRNHTIDCCAAYIARTTAAGHSLWAIEVVDKGYRHIGNITASYDRNNGLADIGILVALKTPLVFFIAASWCSNLSGCHRSSASKKEIHSPRALSTPRLRGAAGPP